MKSDTPYSEIREALKRDHLEILEALKRGAMNFLTRYAREVSADSAVHKKGWRFTTPPAQTTTPYIFDCPHWVGETPTHPHSSIVTFVMP